MRRTSLLVLGCAFLLSPPVVPGGARGEEPNRIVPASGGAEVLGIRIVRRSALSAEKTAEPTGTELELWFPTDWKTKAASVQSIPHLIRLRSLDPIEDDTGKLLLTEARREVICCLRDEERGTSWVLAHGNTGPVMSLALEVPARRAEAIKVIKGQAEVTLAKEVRLRFDDLDAINGKELDHPDFPGLRDMKLKFALKKGIFGWTAEMSAPIKFAGPWTFARLPSWEVVDSENRIWGFPSEGVRPGKEGVTVDRATFYRGGESLKGLYLRLVVLEPVETVTFDFDFQNVPLP